MRQQRRILANSLLFVVSIAISWTVAESVLKAIGFTIDVNGGEVIPPEEKKQLCSINSIAELEKIGHADFRSDPDLSFTLNTKSGFRDSKDFSADYSDYKYRVLVVGDSYTEGLSATQDHDYVTLLNAHYMPLKKAIFFNTGVRGYAVENYLAIATKYVPLLRPSLVLMGFCLINDFETNGMPPTPVATLPHARVSKIDRTCQGDNPCSLHERSVEEILSIYRRAIRCSGSYTTARSFHEMFREECISRSRVLRLLQITYLHFFNKSFSDGEHLKESKRDINFTADALHRMKDYLDSEHVPLIIMAIPMRSLDFQSVLRWNYEPLKDITTTLGLPLIDPYPQLTIDDYVTWIDDNHWNDSGHHKAFVILRDYLDAHVFK